MNQARVVSLRFCSWFLQTTLTDIPNPGMSAALPNAFANTFRLIVLF